MTPPKPKYPEIKVSSFDEPCAVAIQCFILSGNKEQKHLWLKDKKLYPVKTTYGERIMTLVYIKGYYDKIAYLMDVITGSLYNPDTGRCLSSAQVKILNPTKKLKAKSDLKEKLLSLSLSSEGQL